MEKLSSIQILEVKEITIFTSTKFHGNTKKVGSLPIELVKSIVKKKRVRYFEKNKTAKRSNLQIIRDLISLSKITKGTNYNKVLIEGSTGIYYASPIYGHSDYNKCRVFDKTTDNIKLMKLFNKIISK